MSEEVKFSERLKSIREARGLSQEKLSELSLIAQSNISKYETGKLEPDLQALAKLAKVLNVSTNYLLGIDDIAIESPNEKVFVIDEETSIITTSDNVDILKVKEFVEYLKYQKNKN